MVIILGCIVTSVINLTISEKDKELWISLLSSMLGIILPAPKLKKAKIHIDS